MCVPWEWVHACIYSGIWGIIVWWCLFHVQIISHKYLMECDLSGTWHMYSNNRPSLCGRGFSRSRLRLRVLIHECWAFNILGFSQPKKILIWHFDSFSKSWFHSLSHIPIYLASIFSHFWGCLLCEKHFMFPFSKMCSF
jgi:hypothetical protein